jgi:uncharacterized damage-inducible protein DinB
MRYQDQVVRSTHKALEDVVRAARAVPEERLDWSPGGEARSVLNQMQEIATAGAWFLPVVRDGHVPEFDEHARREAARIRQSYDTLEKCIEAARQTTGELCRAIAAVPDERLEVEMRLPFGGGMNVTMADLLGMHAWNMIYHLGQINYVQLMLGDREMH